jgi:hypothetical protein
MRLAIHSISVDSTPYGQKWAPTDPDSVVVGVLLEVGPKGKKGSDAFTIAVATPAGLAALEDDDGVILHRRLLVMRRYEFSRLRSWLEKTVASCEGDTWESCVEKLRRHFDWEYNGYVEC